MKIKNKIIALALAATMVLGTTACSDTGAPQGDSYNKLLIDGEATSIDNIGTYGDDEVSFDLFAIIYLQNKNYYDPTYLEDETVAQNLKDISLETAQSMYAIDSIFEERGLSFTLDDEELLDNTIADAVTAAGSQSAFDQTIADAGISPDMYEYLVKNSIYQQKIIDDITASVTDEEIMTYITENYVRAYHILIESAEKTDADRELAETVLARAKAGEDFHALIEEFGEDPGMVGNEEGYYFTYDEMVAEFEEATFALAEGEISEIVETSYGYHIIKKYPLEEDYINANTDSMTEGYYLSALNDLITEKIEGVEFEPNEYYDMITPETLS